ncbi:VOC family protein [Flammeovirga aprica]|uniref:VOC family protein n=1 Tax=Flammeovirga aprica JL-4 TaxID=694437 RepID=A0A7X9RTU0_9BACT|nr:VOC family protein [Flammeovirga aprica]NME67939.1 VOC family protein [Flammeovirga aprica JL-4]
MKIQKLYLNTPQLEEQLQFYKNILGLPLNYKNETSIAFQIGQSELIFQHSEESKPYHFALNIPFELVEQAVEWVKERVVILKEADSDIQDFSAWKAKAIYFYDKDENIVELIGREDVKGNGDKNFSAASIISISEIGVPSTAIEKVYQSLSQVIELPIYDGSFHRFCAVGDPEGLFICINNEKKGTWFPTEDSALSSGFKIDFLEKGKEVKMVYNEKEGLFEKQ